MNPNDRLDELLLRWEELLEQGQTPSAEELCEDCPELAESLARRIRLLSDMSAVYGNAPTPQSAAQSDTVGVGEAVLTQSSYRIVRLHARGGLGEVLVAKDEELGREVALKRIQPAQNHAPERRRRFLREAELTSRLEHPGIVPVYGLGRDAGGRSCYAMRLIRGESLREAIDRCHSSPPAERTDSPRRDRPRASSAFELRQLLTRFVGVCNAVAYAHSAGVVHRDLKPSNIMLGPYGETLVVDWGLAKELRIADCGMKTRSGAIQPTQRKTPAIRNPQSAIRNSSQPRPARRSARRRT
jgi:serine/threonine protein kinase